MRPPLSRDRQQLAYGLLREASLELARLARIRGAYRRTWRRAARARARLAFAAGLLALAEPVAAGAPIFTSPVPGRVSYSAAPAFADIDGDGDLDAFVGDAYGDTIFFENRRAESPSFGAPSSNPFGLANVGYNAAPAFADIDGDGDLDAFVGQGFVTIFFANTGTAHAPAFAASATNPFGLLGVGPSAAPAFADIDGDGDLDAFIGREACGWYCPDFTTMLFFANTGTASAPAFAPPSSNPFGLTYVQGANPAFADLDGDGDLDAILGAGSGDLVLFENTGTRNVPTFGAPITGRFGLAGVLSAASPAFADLDGDGDLDAFVGGGDGRTAFRENTGAASAPSFVASAGGPLGRVDVGYDAVPAFGDLDGDGDLDAFVGERSGSTIFAANTGTAQIPAFAAPVTNAFGLANVYLEASPELADLDGDGDLDACVSESRGNTLLFANTGSANAPAFAAPVTDPFGLADAGEVAKLELADLDGDGDLDALVGEVYGNTLLFANTGTANAPAFAAPATNPFGLTRVGYAAAPAFADLDGDGDLDAFVGNAFGETIHFPNTGSAAAPAFAAPATNPFGLTSVGYAAAPAFADLDGDGDLDAFIGNYDGETRFFENVELVPDACSDGLDNDRDGAADYPADAGCDGPADASERGTSVCDNGVDEDGDSHFDYPADPGCEGPTDASERGGLVCDNGSDDDGDGAIDYPADPGCSNPADSSERGPACDNGVDDDGDGAVDYPADPGCSSGADLSERGPAACDNGVDDDGDGAVDYPADPGCSSGADLSERGPAACDNGVDDDGDGAVDFPDDLGCDGPSDTGERGAAVCDNGSDDDGDGRTDFPGDAGCESPQDGSEWTPLGPSCASSQLDALADLCSAQLRCRAQHTKSPDGDRAERCLSESRDRFLDRLGRRAAASTRKGEVCETEQAAASASEVETFALDLAADVAAGVGSNRADAVLRAAITRHAGVACRAELRVLAREIEKPSADHGDAALLEERERFLGSAGRAIERGARSGVSYDGRAPDEIADVLRAFAEALADEFAP